MDSLWQLLDKTSIIFGIIVSIPVIWSWIILLGYGKRQKNFIKSLENIKGDKPVAISIDLMPGESENQVLVYLKKNNMEMDILRITKDRLDKDSIDDFVKELYKVKAEAMAKGADKIHLFYRGPITGALITGEVFSNTSVNIYHYDKATGTYESWGALHRSFI